MQAAPSDTKQAVGVVKDQIFTMWTGLLEHLPQIGIAVVVLLAAWGAANLAALIVGKLASSTNQRKSLQVLMRKTARIGVWALGIIVAVTVVFPSITPGKLLTVVGLGGVAVGFAFKDVFENFLAGILILMREPFELGDFIETGNDYEGWVEEITIRDTRLRKTDGQTVIMPNSELFKNPVTVRTARELRRLTIACGVGYGEDVDESREVIRDAVESLDEVNTDKPIQVLATSFGASSIDFDVRFWTGSKPGEQRAAKDKAIAAIKRALDDAGIEIPFPYRTLTFAEPMTVENGQEEDETREAA